MSCNNTYVCFRLLWRRVLSGIGLLDYVRITFPRAVLSSAELLFTGPRSLTTPLRSPVLLVSTKPSKVL